MKIDVNAFLERVRYLNDAQNKYDDLKAENRSHRGDIFFFIILVALCTVLLSNMTAVTALIGEFGWFAWFAFVIIIGVIIVIPYKIIRDRRKFNEQLRYMIDNDIDGQQNEVQNEFLQVVEAHLAGEATQDEQQLLNVVFGIDTSAEVSDLVALLDKKQRDSRVWSAIFLLTWLML